MSKRMRRFGGITMAVTGLLVSSGAIAAWLASSGSKLSGTARTEWKGVRLIERETTIRLPNGATVRYQPRGFLQKAARLVGLAANAPTVDDIMPCMGKGSFYSCDLTSSGVMAATDGTLGFSIRLDGETPTYTVSWRSSASNLIESFYLNDTRCPSGWYLQTGGPLAGDELCWSPGDLDVWWTYPAYKPGFYTFNRGASGVTMPSVPGEVKPSILKVEDGNNQQTLVNRVASRPLVLGVYNYRNEKVSFPIASWSDVRNPMAATIAGPNRATGQKVESDNWRPDNSGNVNVRIFSGSKTGAYYIDAKSDDSNALDPDAVLNALARIDPEDNEEDEEGNGEECAIGDPITIGTGNSFQRETDFRSPDPSILEFTRFYNSRGSRSSLMRNYWTTNYDIHVENAGAVASVQRPDGKVIPFNLVSGVYQSARPYFHGNLERFGLGWRYTTENNLVEVYDSAGNWTSITDGRGRSVTATYSSGKLTKVTSNLGDSLTLAYNAFGQVATIKDGSARTWAYTYDGYSNLTEVRDPDGVYHVYEYASPYAFTSLTGISVGPSPAPGPNERVVTWEYDSQLRVTSNYFVSHFAAVQNYRRFDMVYDGNGGHTVTDGAGSVTTFRTTLQNGKPFIDEVVGPGFTTCGQPDSSIVRDSAQNILSSTKFGRRYEYSGYDAKGQYRFATESAGTPLARTREYAYDPRFVDKPSLIKEPSVVSGQVKSTAIAYNGAGQVGTVTVSGYRPDGTPVSRVKTLAYGGPLGQVSQVAGGVEGTLNFTYGAGNRLTRVVDGQGVVRRDAITYTPTGQVLSETRPNGLSLTYTYYPGSDVLKSVTEAAAQQTRVTNWTYNDRRWVSSISITYNGVSGYVANFTYNSAGDITQIDIPGEGKRRYTFDASGNPVTEEILGGFTVTRTINRVFDAYNRVKSVVEPYSTQSVDIWPDGTLLSRTDGNTNQTAFNYDELKRLTRVIQPGNLTTEFTYDDGDNQTSIRAANGTTTNQVFDDLGNKIREVNSDTGTTSYEHDNAGRVTSAMDALGQITIFSYDNAGNLTGINRSGTDDDAGYIYGGCLNGVGRLCRATRGSQFIDYEYDAFGRVTKQTSNAGSVAYKYDGKDNITEITYPSGRKAVYNLNAAGVVLGIDVVDSGSTYALIRDIKHLPFGPAYQWIYGNGVAETRQFDSQYRPTSIVSGSKSSVAYPIYDGNSNALQRVANGEQQSFGYNALNQLSTASGLFGSQAYLYDAIANRTSLSANGGQPVLYAYQPGTNRLASDSNWTYGRDALGNTTRRVNASGEGMDLLYSAGNRILAVTDAQNPSTIIASYEYDAFQRRTVKHTEQEHRRFVFGSSGELLSESNGSGQVLEEYVYLDGSPIALLGVPQGGAGGTIDQTIDNVAAFGTCRKKNASLAVNGSYIECPTTASGSTILSWGWTAPVAGDYEVQVRWAWTSTNQCYALKGSDERCSGQGVAAGSWMSLGSIHYAQGEQGPSMLEWRNNASSNGQTAMRMDAIRLVLLRRDIQDRDYRYVHADALGTPLRVTDKSATVVWQATYDPYGFATPNVDPDGNGLLTTMNLRFPGQYFDGETGLHYNWHRTYDPGTGRYLEADPIGLLGGMNRYAYVEAGPVSNSDPWGLLTVTAYYRGGLTRDYYWGYSFEFNPLSLKDIPGLTNQVRKFGDKLNFAVDRLKPYAVGPKSKTDYLECRRLDSLLQEMFEEAGYNSGSELTRGQALELLNSMHLKYPQMGRLYGGPASMLDNAAEAGKKHGFNAARGYLFGWPK